MVQSLLFFSTFHVVDLVKCYFSKKSSQFLTFFYLGLVKDFSQLIEAVFSITIQIFKVLFLIFFIPDFDFTFRYSCLGCAFCVILGTYTNVGCYTSIFLLCIFRSIYINAYTTSFIFSFVFNIFIGQCACGDFIFVFFSFTGYNTAFKVGVFTYVNVKAFFTCVDTALVGYAFVFAVNVALTGTTKDTDFISTIFIANRDTYAKASRRVLFFIGILILLAFNIKVSTYVAGYFFTTQLTTFNVGVLAAGEVKVLICLYSAFIVGGAVGIYFTFARASAYSYAAYLTCCNVKAYAYTCTAGLGILLQLVSGFRRSYIKVFFSV